MDSNVRYKWTHANREATHGITDYPQVGRWSERRTPILCESGWHVPTNDMLSYFISTELWEVRVKGAHVADNKKEAWEYIRFVRKVEAWDDKGRLAFIKFCRPENWRYYHAAADIAASAAAVYAARGAARKSQSEWLMQNIILKGQ